jgi:hypothetical protein
MPSALSGHSLQLFAEEVVTELRQRSAGRVVSCRENAEGRPVRSALPGTGLDTAPKTTRP